MAGTSLRSFACATKRPESEIRPWFTQPPEDCGGQLARRFWLCRRGDRVPDSTTAAPRRSRTPRADQPCGPPHCAAARARADMPFPDLVAWTVEDASLDR